MSSPAPKHAESEFDDLLGQLVNELAMTPASESAVSLVPDPPPEPEARVDSTNRMAAEAAEAAQARSAPSGSNTVKIVGIVTASLTAVALAALFVFANPGGENEAVAAVDEDTDNAAEQAEAERLAELAQAERAAAERIQAEQLAAEQAAAAAEFARFEAERLIEEAKQAEESKKKRTRRRSRSRSKPKPKPKPTVSDSFEDL